MPMSMDHDDPSATTDGELIFARLRDRPGKVSDAMAQAAQRLRDATGEPERERIKSEAYEVIKRETLKVSLLNTFIQTLIFRSGQVLTDCIREARGHLPDVEGVVPSPGELLANLGGPVELAVVLYDKDGFPSDFWDDLSRAVEHLIRSDSREEAEDMVWSSGVIREELTKRLAFLALYEQGIVLRMMPPESEKTQ